MIILVRHATTDGNAVRFVGREDPPINEDGERELDALAAALRSVSIDAIVSSPLRRAVATAEAIATGRGLAVEGRSELVEFDFGALSGSSKSTARHNLRRHHLDDPVPGGESLRDVWLRLGDLDAELRERSATQTVAVVGHYWSLRVLRCRQTGLDLRTGLRGDPYKPPTASAYELRSAGEGAPGIWLHPAGPAGG